MMAKAIDCFPNEVNLNFEKLSEIVILFKILIWLERQPSHKIKPIVAICLSRLGFGGGEESFQKIAYCRENVIFSEEEGDI